MALIDYEISEYLEDDLINLIFQDYFDDDAFWINRLFSFYPFYLPIPKEYKAKDWYFDVHNFSQKENWNMVKIIEEGNFKLLDFLFVKNIYPPVYLYKWNHKNILFPVWLHKKGLTVTNLHIYTLLIDSKKFSLNISDIISVIEYFIQVNFPFDQMTIDYLWIFNLEYLIKKPFKSYFITYIFSSKNMNLLIKHIQKIVLFEFKRDQFDLLLSWKEGFEVLVKNGFTPPNWVLVRLNKLSHWEDNAEKIKILWEANRWNQDIKIKIHPQNCLNCKIFKELK